MKRHWSRLLNRFWMWVVTFGLPADRSVSFSFRPGDEDRLIAALINMNTALARVGRMI